MPFSWLEPERLPRPLLRLLPPPKRLSPAFAHLPAAWPGRALAHVLGRHVLRGLPQDSLEFLEGKALTLEVSDLGLRCAITASSGRLRALQPDTGSDATIRGTFLDLLLLSSQLEDADTLFFQRRLVMTGDTALGLQVRNFMDQLPTSQLPPGLRILMNRLARLALAAKKARA